MNFKSKQIRFMGFLLSFLILLTSCQKIVEYIHLPGNGNVDYKFCSIQKVTAEWNTELATYIVHYTFSYNKQGNPVSVKNDYVATGNPNLLFKYDKYNRLVQFVRPYNNGSYEIWDKYGYNLKNQIIRDTQYFLGSFIDSIPARQDGLGYTYINYEYDAQNRIIARTDSFFIGHNTFAAVDHTNYNYDDSGNLILPGVTYDNKLNIRRTNKIWMFITRNYSVNNPFIATSYNEHGLPTSFLSASAALDIIVPQSGKGLVEYLCN